MKTDNRKRLKDTLGAIALMAVATAIAVAVGLMLNALSWNL